MYEENRDQGFDGNGNPDNHRSEEHVPNFVMKDIADPSRPKGVGHSQPVPETDNQDSQAQGRFAQSQGHPQPESFGQNQSQPQPGTYGQNQSQPQPETFGRNQNQPQPGAYGRNQSQPQPGAYGQNQGQPQPESFGRNQNQPQPGTYGQNQSGPQPRTYGQNQGQPQSGGYSQDGQASGVNGNSRNPYWQQENGRQGTAGANGGYYGQTGAAASQGGNQDSSRTGGQPWQMSGNAAGRGKKKRGLVSKAAGLTAAALLFGVVSGGTMVGVNMLADSMKEETYPQVSQATVPEESNASVPNTPANSGAGAQAGNALAMDVSSIVENSMPSIVAINNTMLYESNSWFGGRQTYEVPSSGSGIIVGQNDEELLVVTNNHVVENANTLSVVFIDSESVEAAVKGTDAETDLAVIAVPLKDIPADTLGQISVAKLGNSDELKAGQSVIAIGNALGYGQSVTVGWVSALDREVTTEGGTTRNLLQTDAAINPGNSGGALLNTKGEVIGINVAKYSSTEVEGIGYAIPISKAEDIINSLMTKRTRSNAVEEGKEGYLGIQGFTVEDSMVRQLGMPSGVFVSGIIEGGAASKTDLREKDIITKFDDQTVRTMAALQDMLKYYKEGETVTMTVQSLENGEYVERVIEITLEGRATLGEDTRTSQESSQRNR